MSWTILDTSKLRNIDLFSNLSDNALEKIAAITYSKSYRRSEQIFADGDPGESMYLIIEGEVRISKQIVGLGEEALAILKAGSYFGEMGLLDGQPTSAEAWANRRCILKVIDRQDLLDLMMCVICTLNLPICTNNYVFVQKCNMFKKKTFFH